MSLIETCCHPNLASVLARYPFVGFCYFSRRRVTTSSFDVSNRVNVHSIYPGQLQKPFGVALSVNVVALLFCLCMSLYQNCGFCDNGESCDTVVQTITR